MLSACNTGGSGTALSSPGAPTAGGPSATTVSATSAAPRSAQISEVKSDVTKRETETVDWQSAAEGDEVNAGGGVRTGDESRVRIDISDGTIVRIAPNTEFTLLELSPTETDPITRLQMEAGKVFVWVTKALGLGTFEIETPSGVATVRGSLMSAEYDDVTGRFLITCLEGECRLAVGEVFTDLVEGQQTEVTNAGERPLAARLMDEAQLDDWADNFPGLELIIERMRERLKREATPTPPGGVGVTACDHPYFPIRTGASWSYTSNFGGNTWNVNRVSGDTSSATAEMGYTMTDISGVYDWLCDTTGLVSYQFGGGVNFAGQGQVVTFEVIESSGVFLPPADVLVPGYTWERTYTLQYELTIEGNTFPSTIAVAESFSVVGNDPVTFNGETYPGLQVQSSSSTTLDIAFAAPGGGGSQPITTQASNSLVYARGVGIVSSTSQSQGSTSQSDLVSFTLP
jgi:hypothetical protein